MNTSTDLSNYVRDALGNGRTPHAIEAALAKAGWTAPEIAVALAAWEATSDAEVVPRPVRSSAARDAFFYALLFIVFGTVVGNVLSVSFGLIGHLLPDPSEILHRSAVSSVRWSMAALIVFAPAFWLLDRADVRKIADDPARQHGTLRRWLMALAMLVAVIALMGDALYLIYTWLEGEITLRFVSKSAVVCAVSVLTLAYFGEAPSLLRWRTRQWAATVAVFVSLLCVVLSFWVVGGPDEGRAESRDRSRLTDLRILARDLERCRTTDLRPLPEALDPLTCASNRSRLSGFASEIIYTRVGDLTFDLCIDVEQPESVYDARVSVSVDGPTACIRARMD